MGSKFKSQCLADNDETFKSDCWNIGQPNPTAPGPALGCVGRAAVAARADHNNGFLGPAVGPGTRLAERAEQLAWVQIGRRLGSKSCVLFRVHLGLFHPCCIGRELGF